MQFRPITDDEFEAAYALLVAASQWLNSRGIVQWTTPLAKETYLARQRRGENFGLFEPHLSAVMTLAPNAPDYWAGPGYRSPFLWLSTLASERATPGAGARAVAAAISYASSHGYAALYLDCVDRNDALPAFYRNCGFTLVERREVWPGWPMCLFAIVFDDTDAPLSSAPSDDGRR